VGSAASASDGACGGGGAAVVQVDGLRPRRWHCSPGRWYGFDGGVWMDGYFYQPVWLFRRANFFLRWKRKKE
jgi:hypothetical protein